MARLAPLARLARMGRRLADLWETMRMLRVAVCTIGALAGTAGATAAGLWGAAWRARRELMTDSPEYAADAHVDPTGLAEPLHHAWETMRAWRPPTPPAWWWLPVILALILWIAARIPLARPDNPWERDPARDFPPADRRWIATAVGGRCEHRSLFGLLRCRREGEHADHHYPHSRGGATDRHNLVWLCARHNLRKSDRIPTLLDTWLLYRARLRYLPARYRAYAWPDGRAYTTHSPADDTPDGDGTDPWERDDYDEWEEPA